MGDMKRVAASTTALYSDKTIEVAMMLDVTGSMAGQKIIDLRTAAANAVDSFLEGQDSSNPRVRVSIVPYANSVNAGALAASSVYVETSTSQRKQAPGNGARWRNCPDALSRRRTVWRKGTYQYSDAGPEVSMVNRDYLLSSFAWQTGTAACPAAALKPLTADAAALKNVIKNFVASGGNLSRTIRSACRMPARLLASRNACTDLLASASLMTPVVRSRAVEVTAASITPCKLDLAL
ncbi:hypothetical protein BQ8482_540011 [Mesorhizobium delmotii]|uniref:VWFA domain-containing protein n=1 Tax=Mesorhizobium delmotii TaxID=1631247 RepID=A0A2P9AUK5_9HYPH|nr:hypothetical protein BQ8482_540011 [Mesorhizobium delmotii]